MTARAAATPARTAATQQRLGNFRDHAEQRAEQRATILLATPQAKAAPAVNQHHNAYLT